MARQSFLYWLSLVRSSQSGVAQQVEEAPGSPLSDLQERKLLPNTRAKRKAQLLSARESDLYSTVVSSLLFQGCFKLFLPHMGLR